MTKMKDQHITAHELHVCNGSGSHKYLGRFTANSAASWRLTALRQVAAATAAVAAERMQTSTGTNCTGDANECFGGWQPVCVTEMPPSCVRSGENEL